MIIYLHTSRWRPGQRLAIGGATAALVAAVAWASLGERGASMRAAPRSAGVRSGCGGVRRPHRTVRDTRADPRCGRARALDCAGCQREFRGPPSAAVPVRRSLEGAWRHHGRAERTRPQPPRPRAGRVRRSLPCPRGGRAPARDEVPAARNRSDAGLEPGAPWTVRTPGAVGVADGGDRCACRGACARGVESFDVGAHEGG